jgi:hypothetical protein
MTVGYYIIPMTEPPYSHTNPQRPQYVNEIRCNWTGHNVDSLGVYVCKVNTTDAKHTDLASRTGVRQLPRAYTWSTVISTLPLAARNAISNWCSGKGIPYDATDTIGELLMRIIESGLFDLGATALNTQYQNLSQARKDKIVAICERRGWQVPAATDTVREMCRRLGRFIWPGDDETQVHVEEF